MKSQIRFVLNIVRFVTLHCKRLNRLLDCCATANRSQSIFFHIAKIKYTNENTHKTNQENQENEENQLKSSNNSTGMRNRDSKNDRERERERE